jgi:tetratricopeptide (TPR) repeat protein
VLLTELLSRPSPAYETLVLVDDLYFATDKRDEALQLFAERGVAPPTGSSSAGASNRVFQMARVKVLDEYGQPKEALKIMQSLPAALPEVVSLSTQTGLLKNAPVRSDVLFPDTLLERARLESKLNHTADALAHLQNCIEQNPAAGQPYFVRAQIYAQKSQWTLAAADLTRAIDNGFSLIKARRARSACYSSLAQPGPARDDMSLAAAFTRIAE